MFNVYKNCRCVFKFTDLLYKTVDKSRQNFLKLHSSHLTDFGSRYFSQNAPEIGTIVDTPESEYTEIDFTSIANGDSELEHKLKVIALEVEVMRQEGRVVPALSFFKPDHWREAANLPTRTARRKYFEFLFKISKKKENLMIKKEIKRQERGEKPEFEKCENIEEFAQKYDLSHNSIFLRFYDSTMNQLINNKLVQAMQFGQKLVIDCGYDQNMSKRENVNCAKQLQFLFAENRLHDDPFDVHYCNLHETSILYDYLKRQIPTIEEPWFPINIHPESYLDMFPKENLVYLTPHCREELTEYDHDAIYIIGGIVDKINNEPLSLAKAKREGLRMAKLPLDKYLQWGAGSGKSLTLNHVLSILNDVKSTNDWKYALRHVPRRKIVDFSISSNIIRATDKVRYDRVRKEKKWIPSNTVDFNNLKFNNKKETNKPKASDRIRSIFDE